MKKLIFAVLMIAIVGSLVGIGTWAYFSDYETSEENIFTAGSMDLKVDGKDDPDVARYFEIDGVKPGDTASQLILLRNVGSVDGYADIKFVVTKCAENGMPEPEREVDATWGPDGGELCENMLITVEVDRDRDMVMDETIINDESMSSLDDWNRDLDSIIQAGEYESGGVNYIYIKITWRVPEDVENEIMTDICGFDIEFSLTQIPPLAVFHDLEVCSVGCCPIDTTVGDVAAGECETFKVLEGRTVTVTADDSDVCCDFDNWAGDILQGAGVNPNTVVMDGNKSVTATCVPATYDLTVNSVGCCPIDVGAPINATVAAGGTGTWTDIACNTVISLDADDSEADCTFDNWTGDASGTNPSTTVTMNADKTVNGNCYGVGWNLTVTSDGCCPIDVGAPINATVAAGGTGTWTDIPGGTDVSVSADDSDPCCSFVSWSDGDAQTHDVHMDSNKSVTATCVLLTSDLTVISSGCCPIDVSWDGQGDTVPAGGQLVFENIPCCTDVTVSADDSDECCGFDSWSDAGDQTHIIHMDGTNKTVTATCHTLDSDLDVNSIGCCYVEVWEDGNLVYTLSPGESWSDLDVPCCVNVDVVAIPDPADPFCQCDDIKLDLVSKGCYTASVHMDGLNHVFDVYCTSKPPELPPGECCYCIYAVQYWEEASRPPEEPEIVGPVGDPDEMNYYVSHVDFWRDAGYAVKNACTGAPITIIPVPTYEQHQTYYTYPDWTPTEPGRFNWVILGAEVGVGDMGGWKRMDDQISEVTAFVVNMAYPYATMWMCIYAVLESVTPIVGTPGHPYAPNDQWETTYDAGVFGKPLSRSTVEGMETLPAPLPYSGTLECYKIRGDSWMDTTGSGTPDAWVTTGYTWVHNSFGCSIKEYVMPGLIIWGWENRDLVWYCQSDDIPPPELLP